MNVVHAYQQNCQQVAIVFERLSNARRICKWSRIDWNDFERKKESDILGLWDLACVCQFVLMLMWCIWLIYVGLVVENQRLPGLFLFLSCMTTWYFSCHFSFVMRFWFWIDFIRCFRFWHIAKILCWQLVRGIVFFMDLDENVCASDPCAQVNVSQNNCIYVCQQIVYSSKVMLLLETKPLIFSSFFLLGLYIYSCLLPFESRFMLFVAGF